MSHKVEIRIMIVLLFHVPCFSYAPEHTRNHISETPVFFAVILVHSACLMHLLKLCSQKFQHACLNFYFAPFTCCLASFHAHTYYHALLILLYNSFVNSRRQGLALKCSSLKWWPDSNGIKIVMPHPRNLGGN